MALVLDGTGSMTFGNGSISGLSNAAIPSTKIGAGAVLQVVSATKTDTFSTTSTAFVDITGLSVSITPISSSNKVFVTVDVTGQGQATVSIAGFRLVRDSTVIGAGAAVGVRSLGFAGSIATDNNISVTQGTNFLDSPSSTSSVTYKVQVRISSGGTVFVNRPVSDAEDVNIVRTASTITVMEIAA